MVFFPRGKPEADHSLVSGAEVTNAWHYTSTFPYVFMAWCLVIQCPNISSFIDLGNN